MGSSSKAHSKRKTGSYVIAGVDCRRLEMQAIDGPNVCVAVSVFFFPVAADHPLTKELIERASYR